jgi:hypothetical protein
MKHLDKESRVTDVSTPNQGRKTPGRCADVLTRSLASWVILALRLNLERREAGGGDKPKVKYR